MQGEWRSGLNGGDKSGDSWLSNPQYFFQLSQPARVVAIISSAVKGNFGVYIVKATGACPLGGSGWLNLLQRVRVNAHRSVT